MGYSGLIAELFRRSGMGVTEYAEKVADVEQPHLSNILNGKEDGSRKILEKCLAHIGLTIGDLRLKDKDADKEQEIEALALFRSLNEEKRGLAFAVLNQFAAAQRAERKPKRKPSPDTSS